MIFNGINSFIISVISFINVISIMSLLWFLFHYNYWLDHHPYYVHWQCCYHYYDDYNSHYHYMYFTRFDIDQCIMIIIVRIGTILISCSSLLLAENLYFPINICVRVINEFIIVVVCTTSTFTFSVCIIIPYGARCIQSRGTSACSSAERAENDHDLVWHLHFYRLDNILFLVLSFS